MKLERFLQQAALFGGMVAYFLFFCVVIGVAIGFIATAF